MQDLIRLGNWTISAGLRWDHYQLLVNRQAVDPRFSISRYFPSADLLVHFSYDRVFQTPSFENILLSSSTAVESLDPSNFLRLPVEPSEGNYYEAGLTKAVLGKIKLDANYFRRLVDNYADDDQIDQHDHQLPDCIPESHHLWRGSETRSSRLAPILGLRELFLHGRQCLVSGDGRPLSGDDATTATTQTLGHFPDSQDQRNTVRGRVRYQVAPRFWIAGGIQYDTGLPFEFDGDPATVLAEYGQQVLNRINFARGRIYPSFQVNASAGADVYKSDRVNMQLQVDGQNLTNVLDVIDFGGLFSGNAIGPSRSFGLRLTTNF